MCTIHLQPPTYPLHMDMWRLMCSCCIYQCCYTIFLSLILFGKCFWVHILFMYRDNHLWWDFNVLNSVSRWWWSKSDIGGNADTLMMGIVPPSTWPASFTTHMHHPLHNHPAHLLCADVWICTNTQIHMFFHLIMFWGVATVNNNLFLCTKCCLSCVDGAFPPYVEMRSYIDFSGCLLCFLEVQELDHADVMDKICFQLVTNHPGMLL